MTVTFHSIWKTSGPRKLLPNIKLPKGEICNRFSEWGKTECDMELTECDMELTECDIELTECDMELKEC